MTTSTGTARPDGFDSAFLGLAVPLPKAALEAGLLELRYTHFTVLLHPQRRLAAATAVNVDGALLREVGRVDEWRFDERVPVEVQAGEELYAGNDLDRGHLVRRRDPVWGEPEVAARANVDTFVYPNAAPQAAEFNQSKLLWNGLEDYVLEHARAHRQRLSVLTGPVLAADDPVYRGLQLPRRYWKIAAWTTRASPSVDVDEAELLMAATGYLLDQSPQLRELEDERTARARAADQVPPLGPFRTFQVPIAELAALTGLDLGPLPAADRLATVPVAAAVDSAWDVTGSDVPIRWRPLQSEDDVRAGLPA